MASHSTPCQPGRLHIASVPADASSAWHWQPLELAEDPHHEAVQSTLASMSYQILKV